MNTNNDQMESLEGKLTINDGKCCRITNGDPISLPISQVREIHQKREYIYSTETGQIGILHIHKPELTNDVSKWKLAIGMIEDLSSIRVTDAPKVEFTQGIRFNISVIRTPKTLNVVVSTCEDEIDPEYLTGILYKVRFINTNIPFVRYILCYQKDKPFVLLDLLMCESKDLDYTVTYGTNICYTPLNDNIFRCQWDLVERTANKLDIKTPKLLLASENS